MVTEQEKIRFDHMKNTYNWWSKVPKSLGIILWFISMYCNFNLAERVLVGDGQVWHPGEKKLLAMFIWNDELNIPIFTFMDEDSERYRENQNIYIKGLQEMGTN